MSLGLQILSHLLRTNGALQNHWLQHYSFSTQLHCQAKTGQRRSDLIEASLFFSKLWIGEKTTCFIFLGTSGCLALWSGWQDPRLPGFHPSIVARRAALCRQAHASCSRPSWQRELGLARSWQRLCRVCLYIDGGVLDIKQRNMKEQSRIHFVIYLAHVWCVMDMMMDWWNTQQFHVDDVYWWKLWP